jgi:hypothetical protein
VERKLGLHFRCGEESLTGVGLIFLASYKILTISVDRTACIQPDLPGRLRCLALHLLSECSANPARMTMIFVLTLGLANGGVDHLV